MAIAPQNPDAFLREVDDEVRRDRMLSLWQRFGTIGLVAVGAFLVLLAGGLWWKSHRAALAEADAEQLAAIANDAEANRVGATDKRLTGLAETSRPGYAALARLTQAGIVTASDPKRAATLYLSIANDGAAARPMRDLAMIRATTLQLDTLPPREIVDRMKPLAVAGNPWFGSAGELTGAAYLRMSRPDLAGPIFAALARDAAVPSSIRGRAANMATALGQTVGTLPQTGALKG